MSDQQGFIVVGVDGTPGSAAALDFALAEGLSRGMEVEVVTAWMLEPPAGSPASPASPDDVGAGRSVNQDLQNRMVSRALERFPVSPVVSHLVVHDYAGRVLSARAASAALLVVGGGSQSASSRKTLGSVAEYCIRHAAVPVVVVPEPDRARRRHPRRAPGTVTPKGDSDRLLSKRAG